MIIDFHSHILPEMDDGSESLEMSLNMLELAGDQGVSHVLATPHFYPHRENLDAFLQQRDRAEGMLRGAAAGRPELPGFDVGAEVFFFRGMSESEGLQRLTLGASRYILVEMPFTAWTDSMYRELERIHERQGLTPVIAHVERYLGTFSLRGIPQRLAGLPVLVQSNGEFFLNRRTASRALGLLKQGRIHLLGSDCHNLGSRRPNLGETAALIERQLGAAALARIQRNGERILAQIHREKHTS